MLEDFRQLFIVILWDVRKLGKDKFHLAAILSRFVFQVLLLGYVLSHIVDSAKIAPSFDYYKFYMVGSYVAVLLSLSTLQGYTIVEEFEEGVIDYHLSLPISRKVLALGRVLGGGIAVFLLSLPMSLVLAYILRSGVLSYSCLLLLSLVFALALTSESMTLALALRASEKLDAIMGVLDSLAIRLSTAFYPITAIASIAMYYYIALGNPVSHLADLIRFLFSKEVGAPSLASPWLMSAYTIGFAITAFSIAVSFVDRRAEGG